jgi:hypothetical protein
VDEARRVVYGLQDDILDAADSKNEDELRRIAGVVYDMTDGAFDITLAPVVRAWGFSGDKSYRVPTPEELQDLLARRSYDDVDFGGIAKGYASDLTASSLRGAPGVTGAIINLGGNVYAVGGNSGKPWRVAIRDPFDGDKTVGTLEVKDRAVVTSGGYERYFERDGVRYHHIIDPRTGYPASSGLASVTVVCASGAMADGLSTGLFVLGKERALEIWRENRELFDLVLTDDGGAVTITEGLTGAFTGGDYDVAKSSVIGVFSDGVLVHSVDLLTVKRAYDFDVDGTNVVHIERGEAYMLSADCRDQICVLHAHLVSGGQNHGDTPIVCLPNRVVIKWI